MDSHHRAMQIRISAMTKLHDDFPCKGRPSRLNISHETNTGDDEMNSGTFDWIEALIAIDARRLAAQPKPTKKTSKDKGAKS